MKSGWVILGVGGMAVIGVAALVPVPKRAPDDQPAICSLMAQAGKSTAAIDHDIETLFYPQTGADSGCKIGRATLRAMFYNLNHKAR